MRRHQRSLTLGELIQVVSQYSRNDHEVGLVVADLLQRGVVIRARPAAVHAALRSAGRVRKL
jgi:hypothetical protein